LERKTELNFIEMKCIEHIKLLLSLQMFFSLIQTSVFDNLFLFMFSSFSTQRDWGDRVLSSLMITFQRDDSQVLERESSLVVKQAGGFTHISKGQRNSL
jgi:hypothetical protein